MCVCLRAYTIQIFLSLAYKFSDNLKVIFSCFDNPTQIKIADITFTCHLTEMIDLQCIHEGYGNHSSLQCQKNEINVSVQSKTS